MIGRSKSNVIEARIERYSLIARKSAVVNASVLGFERVCVQVRGVTWEEEFFAGMAGTARWQFGIDTIGLR